MNWEVILTVIGIVIATMLVIAVNSRHRHRQERSGSMMPGFDTSGPHPDEQEWEDCASRWRALRARFIRNPGLAVDEADCLAAEVLHSRGLPVEDSEDPDYVEAHVIALRQKIGAATPDELRQAMAHFDSLFERFFAQ